MISPEIQRVRKISVYDLRGIPYSVAQKGATIEALSIVYQEFL